MLVVANQIPGLIERYGITREEADRTAWTIDLDGRRAEGAAAIARVLDVLGGGWRILAMAYRVPPIGRSLDAFYRWFAPRRAKFHRLGVKPEWDD